MVKKTLPHIHSFLIKTLSKIFKNNGLLIKCIVEIHINRKLKVYKGKSITREYLRLLPLRMLNLGSIPFVEYENIKPKKGEIIPNFPTDHYNTHFLVSYVLGFNPGEFGLNITKFLQNNKLYVQTKLHTAIRGNGFSRTMVLSATNSNLLPLYYCALINYMFSIHSYAITSLQDFILNAVIPYSSLFKSDFIQNYFKYSYWDFYYSSRVNADNSNYPCQAVNKFLPIDEYTLTIDGRSYGLSENSWYPLDITFTLIFEVI